MLELFRYRQSEDMLQRFEDLTILTDEDVAIVALNEEKDPVGFFTYVRYEDLELESYMSTEIFEKSFSK